jgi:hypothetical protein
MSARPVDRTSRLLRALALIVLVLAGRFAGSFHAAESNHVVCPDHGELLHVADAHDHGDDHAEGAPLGAGIRPVDAPDAHEHCLLETLMWASGTTWLPADVHAVVVPGVAAPAVVTDRGARFALPPLSFAPKHSPPASVA